MSKNTDQSQLALWRALNTASASLQKAARSETAVFQAFDRQLQKLNLHGLVAMLASDSSQLITHHFIFPQSQAKEADLLLDELGFQTGSSEDWFTHAPIFQQLFASGEAIFVANNTELLRSTLTPAEWQVVLEKGRPFYNLPAVLLPIFINGQTTGVLYLAGPELHETALPALTVFGQHLSIALENARLYQRAHRAEHRFRRLFNNAADGIVLVDPATACIQAVNDRLLRMTGYDEDALLGHDVRERLTNGRAPEQAQSQWHTILSEGEGVFEMAMRRADDSLMVTEISATKIEIGPERVVQAIVRDITVQQQTQQALRASRDALHDLIQQIPVGIQVFDRTGLCVDANQALLEAFGLLSREQVVGQYNIFDDKLAERMGTAAAARQALAGEVVHLGDINFDLSRGDPRFSGEGDRVISVTIFPVFSADGQVEQFVGLNVDVTIARQATSALRQREEQLRILTENVPGVIYQCLNNERFTVIHLNDAVTELTGYPKSAFLEEDLSILDICHPDDLHQMTVLIEEDLHAGNRYCYIYRIRHRSGEWVWVEDYGGGVFDENGRLLFLEGFVVDITKRKQAELQQKALYDITAIATSDISTDALYPKIHEIISKLMPADNLFIALTIEDEAWLSVPYAVDEHVSTNGRYEPIPRQRSLVGAMIEAGESRLLYRAEQMGLVARGEADLIGDYSAVWLGVPLFIRQRCIGGLVVQHYESPDAYGPREQQLLTFISGQIALVIERQRTVNTLQQMTARLRQQVQVMDTVLARVPFRTAVVDLDGRITYISPSGAQFLGMSLSESIGKLMRELPVDSSIIEFEERLRQQVAHTGQPETVEQTLTAQDSKITLEYSMVPIRDEAEQVTAVVTTITDITHRKQQQEAMYHAQKLESLGVLAGGIAHDFNNLLAAMLGQVSIALTKAQPESPARPHLKKVMTAAQRAADVTHQLLSYSGRGDFALHILNLNDLITENHHLLQATIPKQVRLTLNLTEDLPAIKADRGQIQQVIMNLIINGAEAMGDYGGGLTLCTRTHRLQGDETKYWQWTNQPLSPGQYVLFCVEDEGQGMDEATMARIFDPFFTTKFTGRGLGLATVLGIVRGHQGGLLVKSKPGQGARFEVLFPAAAERPLPPPKPEPVSRQAPAATPASVSSLLVVDDEEAVRAAVADILSLENIPVLKAENGQEALTLYKTHQAEIGLVLLDLSMPGMSGQETFQALLQIDADVQVLLTSGYSQEEAIRPFGDQAPVGFLQKPFDLHGLLDAVRVHLTSVAE